MVFLKLHQHVMRHSGIDLNIADIRYRHHHRLQFMQTIRVEVPTDMDIHAEADHAAWQLTLDFLDQSL